MSRDGANAGRSFLRRGGALGERPKPRPRASWPVGVAWRTERIGEVERLHMARAFLGRPLYWTSVYLVGDTLVDSGCSSARPAFARWLAEKRVTTVLTTHEHEDHIGNHAILPRDALVQAPALARRFLDEGHPPFPLYRRAVWGYHEKAPGAQLVGARVKASDRSFRVLQTDGHSDDHVAFLDEAEQALYAGDAYMGRFRAARLEEDVHTEIRSLRAMAALDPTILMPAHGPVLPRPRARLLETAQHFEDLARQAHALADKGFAPRRIRRELLGREPALTGISLGEFSGEKLVVNLLRERPA